MKLSLKSLHSPCQTAYTVYKGFYGNNTLLYPFAVFDSFNVRDLTVSNNLAEEDPLRQEVSLISDS